MATALKKIYEINGTATREAFISEDFLNTFKSANTRAKNYFLKNGYIEKKVELKIAHINNVELSDIISYDEVLYIVTEIIETIAGAKAVMTITCSRWDEI